MSEKDKVAIATLAAAIVTVRGAQSVPKIQEALEDATWILYPGRPAEGRYKAWQTSRGLTPTTEEEDKLAAERYLTGMQNLIEKI